MHDGRTRGSSHREEPFPRQREQRWNLWYRWPAPPPGRHPHPRNAKPGPWLRPERACDRCDSAWRGRDLPCGDAGDTQQRQIPDARARCRTEKCEHSASRNPLLQRPCSWLVLVDVPLQITGRGFMNNRADRRQVCGHMMFKASLADEMQQTLQIRDLHHAGAPESLQGIIGKTTLAEITADGSFTIVG